MPIVTPPPVIWYIGPKVRCDLVGYSGINMNGVRRVVSIWPTGSRKGGIRTDQLKSLVILAPAGVRVILCTSADKNLWESGHWRAIRTLEGSMFLNNEKRTGVRIPDLDWMDPPEAKKTSDGMQTGFPRVNSVKDGTGYTFGHGNGTLHDMIRAIYVEREAEPISDRTDAKGETLTEP